MGASSFRVGLLRLVMGGAFILVGFFLASTTTARADDTGLLGVGGAAAAVEPVVESASAVGEATTAETSPAPATAAVGDAVATSVEAVRTVVTEPVKAVEQPSRTVESVAKPVKAVVAVVDEPVAAARQTASTTTASAMTLVVEAPEVLVVTVQTVAGPAAAMVVPPVTAVVEPVVAVVEPVLGVVDVVGPGVVTAPPNGLPIDGTLVPGAGPAPGVGALSQAVGHPPHRASTTAATATRPVLSPPGHCFVTGAGPTTDATSSFSFVGRVPRMAAGASDQPLPQPSQPQPDAVPSSGSGSGASSILHIPDATTASAFSLPENSPYAPTSRTSRLRPGPVADPGSRPD